MHLTAEQQQSTVPSVAEMINSGVIFLLMVCCVYFVFS